MLIQMKLLEFMMVSMAKIKVQAQHLKAGDIVGSGEKVESLVQNSIHFPSNKVYVMLRNKDDSDSRGVLWGKYTQITVERSDGN